MQETIFAWPGHGGVALSKAVHRSFFSYWRPSCLVVPVIYSSILEIDRCTRVILVQVPRSLSEEDSCTLSRRFWRCLWRHGFRGDVFVSIEKRWGLPGNPSYPACGSRGAKDSGKPRQSNEKAFEIATLCRRSSSTQEFLSRVAIR